MYIVTSAEVEAESLCQKAGLISLTAGGTNKQATGADYILALAERIKNERQRATLSLSATVRQPA